MFYLKPPRGEISLSYLEELAEKRLRFLGLLDEPVDLDDSNLDTAVTRLTETLADHGDLAVAVADRTPEDRVSHFVLRFVASRGRGGFRSFFLSRESRLFTIRFYSATLEARETALFDLQRHLRELLSFSYATKERYSFKSAFGHIHRAVTEILDNEMLDFSSKQIRDSEVLVPFEIVPRLVSRREATLRKVRGNIVLRLEDVPNFLSDVFRLLLSIPGENECVEDDRIQDIGVQILQLFAASGFCVSDYNVQTGARRKLKAIDVQPSSAFFPPCFVNVHQKLTRLHRLRHHARIGYTLFLKEIGLGLEEAQHFWQWHYSRSASVDGICSHSWQQDGRRYMYSIRHLYGLEGARKNYSAYSCSAIQQRDSYINDQLVCPFKSYDIEDLGKVLRKSLSGDQHEDIVSQSSSDPSRACALYFKKKYLSICTSERSRPPNAMTSPVQFFDMSASSFNYS